MSDFKAKMHQIRFRLGFTPDPSVGAYSAPQTPSWILGVLLLGEGKEGKEMGDPHFQIPEYATAVRRMTHKHNLKVFSGGLLWATCIVLSWSV